MGAKQLYINGIGTGEYGIYISSDTYLNAPAPDYVAHPIPGRSGDLLQWNNRLNNIARKFTCYIPDNAQSNMDGFKKLLYGTMGYLEISSDYEPDTYQRGYLAEEIEAEPFQSDEVLRVTFDLTFSCEPQKYIKDVSPTTVSKALNTSPQTSYVVPRSHGTIQKLFQALPTNNVPDGDAFVMVLASSNTLYTSGTFDNVTFSMPDYDGFVALALISAPQNSDTSVIRSVVGYSNFGQIDASSYSEELPYAAQGMNFVVILPIGALGTLSASIDVTYNGTTTTLSISQTFAPVISISRDDAVGIHYSLKVSGDYYYYTPGLTSYDKLNNIYIVGKLNGKKTFSALWTFNSLIFQSVCPAQDEYPAYFKFDSETFAGSGEGNGNPVKISEYLDALGTPDGIADELEVYWYRGNWLSFRWTRWELTPRWWKI